MAKIDFSKLDIDKLLDEVEKRGFLVYRPGEVLTHYTINELQAELAKRHRTENFDIDTAINELELRGFYVTNENAIKQFIQNLYYEVISLSPEQIVKVLNQKFIQHIEKWI